MVCIWLVVGNVLLSVVTVLAYDCGLPNIQPDAGARIVNGQDALPGAFPWTLAIERRLDGSEEDYEISCTAVLIDTVWAVTSAQCVDDTSYEYRLILGMVQLESIGQTIPLPASSIHLHPDFEDVGFASPHDIALLELVEDADIDDPLINPICLPPSPDFIYIENPNCFMTGWGQGVDGVAERMQRATTDVIRRNNCQIRWTGLGITILDTNTCTLDQVSRTTSACGVDMGGPLQCLLNARFELAAVASFTADGCPGETGQVWSSLPPYLNWVYEVTGLGKQ